MTWRKPRNATTICNAVLGVGSIFWLLHFLISPLIKKWISGMEALLRKMIVNSAHLGTESWLVSVALFQTEDQLSLWDQIKEGSTWMLCRAGSWPWNTVSLVTLSLSVGWNLKHICSQILTLVSPLFMHLPFPLRAPLFPATGKTVGVSISCFQGKTYFFYNAIWTFLSSELPQQIEVYTLRI